MSPEGTRLWGWLNNKPPLLWSRYHVTKLNKELSLKIHKHLGDLEFGLHFIFTPEVGLMSFQPPGPLTGDERSHIYGLTAVISA